MPLNINGRICFYYSVFWGILAIFLMKIIHPKIRNFLALLLKKFNYKNINNIIIAINIFLAIDCIISAYAINLFTIRMIVNYDLNVTNKNSIIKINQKIEQNKLNQK